MEHQLRNYLIRPGQAEQFAREWADGVRPLREAAGFRIEGAWILPAEDRFAWVLAWPGPGTFAEADARYYRSQERARLDPDPARLIVDSRDMLAIEVR